MPIQNPNVVGVWSGTNDPAVTYPTQVQPGQIWLDTSRPKSPVFKVLLSLNPTVWQSISMNFTGGWDPLRQYNHQDIAYFGNSSYICKAPVLDGGAPNTNPTNWTPMAWSGPYATSSTSTIDGVNQPGILGMPSAGFCTLYAQFGQPAPSGWLFADGTSYSQSQFPALFAIIRTTWNKNGDPAGTFRVPNIPKVNASPSVGWIIKT